MLAAVLALCLAAPLDAATIAISGVTNTSTCVTSDSDNGNDDEDAYNTSADACTEPTGGADGNFMRLTDSGTDSSSAGYGASTTIDFDIDAGVAADSAVDFGDEYERGKIRYSLDIDVTAVAGENWTVDLDQDVLGLFGFHGDGTATAVLTQDNGNAGITTIDVDIDATDYSFTPSPGGTSQNPSNNDQTSVAFSGSRSDSTIASGTGSGSFTMTISFDIDAFSNTGCSGFICSSASGGEDAAVLLGWDNVDDSGGGTLEGIHADNYSEWGRSVGPDGYNSTLTLNVSLCGDGSIDSGEACDDGTSNGLDSCCGTDCQVRGAGESCRAAAGICDLEETCDGVSAACPADSFAAPTVVCRAASSGDLCDVDELCDGATADCPADGVAAGGTVCRAEAGDCDVEETCDGVGKTCPADVIESAGTQCRAVAGVCDVAESCDGVSASCPADGFDTGTACRAVAGVCDVAESCDGSGPNCPADGFDSGTECRTSAGVCDVAESCDGSGANCPADGFDTGTECRASAGVCDPAESCDGSGISCPADVLDFGTECRADSGQCDVAESCDGVGVDCPADGFEPDGTSCDDGDSGTILDQCTTGACAGTPLSGNLDAFKCYKAKDLKNPKFLKTTIGQLDDQFQNITNTLVKRPFLHCNPTEIESGGLFNPTDHLVCYKVKPNKFLVRPRVEVTNVFGTIQLEAKKSFLICLPSSKTVLP